jgi:hypothetical protein
MQPQGYHEDSKDSDACDHGFSGLYLRDRGELDRFRAAV